MIKEIIPMEDKIVDTIIKEYIMERQLIHEGWGDVAGSALGGVSSALQKAGVNKEVQKTQLKIKAIKGELSKCGDSKWCKVKKHARLMALNNHLDELRRKRGYK